VTPEVKDQKPVDNLYSECTWRLASPEWNPYGSADVDDKFYGLQ